MRSKSPKSVCASLVNIHPLVQKTVCRQERMPTGSAPKTICPPPLWLGDINMPCFCGLDFPFTYLVIKLDIILTQYTSSRSFLVGVGEILYWLKEAKTSKEFFRLTIIIMIIRWSFLNFLCHRVVKISTSLIVQH